MKRVVHVGATLKLSKQGANLWLRSDVADCCNKARWAAVPVGFHVGLEPGNCFNSLFNLCFS